MNLSDTRPANIIIYWRFDEVWRQLEGKWNITIDFSAELHHLIEDNEIDRDYFTNLVYLHCRGFNISMDDVYIISYQIFILRSKVKRKKYETYYTPITMSLN